MLGFRPTSTRYDSQSDATGVRLRRLGPRYWSVLGPLGLVFGLLLLIDLTGADRAVCQRFYNGQRWHLRDNEPWFSLSQYGPWVPLAVGVAGLGVAFVGSFWHRWRPYRFHGLYLVLFLVLGPGVLVNLVIKEVSGRPRPSETVEFGGQHRFVSVWQLGRVKGHKSFPSGHAAVWYYLMAPAFLLSGQHRHWAAVFLGFGVFAGSLMGTVRIIQGRHFPSDIVGSCACVYFSGLFLYWVMEWLTNRKNGPAAACC